MELCGRGTSFGLVDKRYDLREKGESVQLSLVVALNKLVRLRFLGTCGVLVARSPPVYTSAGFTLCSSNQRRMRREGQLGLLPCACVLVLSATG